MPVFTINHQCRRKNSYPIFVKSLQIIAFGPGRYGIFSIFVFFTTVYGFVMNNICNFYSA